MLKKSKVLKIEDIKIGDRVSFKVKITDALINSFARLTGDYNPLHTKLTYAKKFSFRNRVAHGMLVGSFFSTLVGMYLPGERSLIVRQEINYRKPVLAGDELNIVGQVTGISRATRLVNLEIKAYRVRQKEMAVLSKALVFVRK